MTTKNKLKIIREDNGRKIYKCNGKQVYPEMLEMVKIETPRGTYEAFIEMREDMNGNTVPVLDIISADKLKISLDSAIHMRHYDVYLF